MKILVNCTSCVLGGGVQVAAEFLYQFATRYYQRFSFRYCVSRNVAETVAGRGFQLESSDVFEYSPSRSSVSRRLLRAIERDWEPDVVFTVFGPAYVKFKSPHFMGIADGWITHANRLAYRTVSNGFGPRFMRYVSCVYKGLWLRNSTEWMVEAEAAKIGFCAKYFVPPEKVHVISNCCGSNYLQSKPSSVLGRFADESINILVFSAPYTHKNLVIVPDVLSQLKAISPSQKYNFTFTLPSEHPIWVHILSKAKQLGVEQFITNVGVVPGHVGPSLYENAAIVFLPTLLETFTAVYPEAMTMQRPIVTTDLDFARAICGDAALYFSPLDAADAAQKINDLVKSKSLVQTLTRAGTEQLKQFSSPEERCDAVIRELLRISKREQPSARPEN